MITIILFYLCDTLCNHRTSLFYGKDNKNFYSIIKNNKKRFDLTALENIL